MTKKKKTSAADDLLESLLEDVKSSPTNPPPEFSAENSDEASFDVFAEDKPLPESHEAPLDLPEIQEGGYQSIDDILNLGVSSANDKTMAIDSDIKNPASSKSEPKPEGTDIDRTVAVTAFVRKKSSDTGSIPEKVMEGHARSSVKIGQVYTSVDASLAQSETLKLAQQRILSLEKDLDRLRQENEELASAAEVVGRRSEELEAKLNQLEKERNEIQDQAQSEALILKGHLQYKEMELNKAKLKVEELEHRLKTDFKKIRTRERDLENRLELVRADRQALLQSKDEHILELQRRIDNLSSEIENYRAKLSELNRSFDMQTEQMKRTVRALRLALANLETQGEPTPLKKAE